jgi:ATP-dependent helicase/nuclease subunit B
LRSLAIEQGFQPEGGPAPIQILGLLEGTGLAFDALWVTGLAADRWPSASSPNPLLPLAWQRERNVAHATAAREREYAEGLTLRFASAAPEVVFSFASSVDDHALSPSALILAYEERPLPPVHPAWASEIAFGTKLETLVDDRAPPLARGSRAPGGAHIVAAQSDCPFKAVARYRLRAKPWPMPCAGLTPLERGLMVHAALARFWLAVRDHATLVALEEDALTGHIGAAIDHALRELSPSRWRTLPALVRDGEARRLEGLMRAWLAVERGRPAFTAEALEARVSLQLAGLEFSLQRDRVDTLADGGVAILDYKTGQVDRPRQWFEDRPRSAQLGLYTLAQHALPESAVRVAAYVELRPEAVSVAGLCADEDAWPGLDPAALAPGGTWASLEAWWRRELEALAAEIASGHAAVTPRVAPSPCRNCGLQPVCRIESVRAVDPNEATDE